VECWPVSGSVGSCVSAARSTRVCGVRLAVLMVTSMLAGTYVLVVLLKHARRRTVLRTHGSRDDDVTAESPPPTVIGEDWRSRGQHVDVDFAVKALHGACVAPLLQLSETVCLVLLANVPASFRLRRTTLKVYSHGYGAVRCSAAPHAPRLA